MPNEAGTSMVIDLPNEAGASMVIAVDGDKAEDAEIEVKSGKVENTVMAGKRGVGSRRRITPGELRMVRSGRVDELGGVYMGRFFLLRRWGCEVEMGQPLPYRP